MLPDYTLIIGGTVGWGNTMFDTVQLVSPDPTSYNVSECMQGLGNFPTVIYGAVGTTFGMYRRAESEYHIQNMWQILFQL